MKVSVGRWVAVEIWGNTEKAVVDEIVGGGTIIDVPEVVG